MAQESTTSKLAEHLPDTTVLMAQLQALQVEVAKLAAAAAKSGEAMGKDVARDLSQARDSVTRKAHETDARIEHAVAANPYLSLGIVALVGLLVGMLARR